MLTRLNAVVIVPVCSPSPIRALSFGTRSAFSSSVRSFGTSYSTSQVTGVSSPAGRSFLSCNFGGPGKKVVYNLYYSKLLYKHWDSSMS